ncbi:MAG: hypothetical protein PHX24_12235 [Acidithiobacillus sp.]|nr:hypothetical protein [Acidithiobacillus sp.]
MNKNSYPVYSKQEQTLAFSVSMGLTFGELCILALRHPMMDFSQFLLRRNHLSPFMIYFLWFGAAFIFD